MINQNKRLLGIDPGTNMLGYAIIEVAGKNIEISTLGVIKLAKLKDHSSKLKEIFLQVQDLIELFQPAEMAIEAPFYGKNIQSMLKLGRAQGVCMAAAYTLGLNVYEYSPKKIKQSITGNGNASKEQVSKMLERILNVNLGDEYHDSTDALATAMCHNNQGSGLISAKSKKFKDWNSFIQNNPDKLL